jgi:hypothetical protein
VLLKPGQPYRGDEPSPRHSRRFTDLFGLYGYAFARVEPRPEIDRATGQVAVVLHAEPQRRVYVRRIDVAGNTRTRDEVVRREFRQLESAWYDGGASSCRATVSTAWATSRTSRSRPTKWPARPTRSTWWSTSPRSPPAT